MDRMIIRTDKKDSFLEKTSLAYYIRSGLLLASSRDSHL